MQQKHCLLTIITRSEGSESVFTASGTYTRTQNIISILYDTEGDVSSLLFGKDEIVMERCGVVTLFARFAEGGATCMTTVCGSSRADIPVRTRTLVVKQDFQGIHADLEYDLIFGSTFSKFSLELSVFFSEDP